MLPAWMARVLKPYSRSAMRFTLLLKAGASARIRNAGQRMPRASGDSAAHHLGRGGDLGEAAARQVHRRGTGELVGGEAHPAGGLEVEGVRRVERHGHVVSEVAGHPRGSFNAHIRLNAADHELT